MFAPRYGTVSAPRLADLRLAVPDMPNEEAASVSRKKATSQRRRLQFLLLAVLALSSYQYLTQGRVTWPGSLFAVVTGKLEDYATRPEAGWRQAGEQIEAWGARREGEPPPPADLRGRVVGVLDGDSLIIRTDAGAEHTVRLFGIDTPERGQPHADQARSALRRMVSRQQVGVVRVDTDKFNRVVGTVYRDGDNINLAMVAAGHAWWFRRYAPYERALQEAERTARAQASGLWSRPDPIPPWEWRRQH